MPDYDQKNIPTLDDIIEEEDVAENIDINETAPDDPTEEENAPGLFSEGSTEDATEEAVDDEGVDDQAYGDDKQHVETEQHNGQHYEEQRHEEQHYPQVIQTSAQITYQEIYDKSINPSPDVMTDADDPDTDDPGTNSHIDEPLTEAIQPSIDPIELDDVVGGVVKQLLPDLEQQLRFLIQRALEEKLPGEIIKPTDTAASFGSDIDSDIDLDTENT